MSEPKCPICGSQLIEVEKPDSANPRIPDYLCEKHGPVVEMKVMFPRNVIGFLESVKEGLDMTPEEYIYHSIIHAIAADLDAGDVFVPKPKQYVEKFQLKPLLQACHADNPSF
jgi:hypothetical protein